MGGSTTSRRTPVRRWSTRSSRAAAWFWRRERAYGELPDRPGNTADTDTGLVVREALARLTARQRAVLVLRYWEDLSVEATAEALGMRTNTVKSHTARGLAALRAGMAEELV